MTDIISYFPLIGLVSLILKIFMWMDGNRY